MRLSVRRQAWGPHQPFYAYRLYFPLPSSTVPAGPPVRTPFQGS